MDHDGPVASWEADDDDLQIRLMEADAAAAAAAAAVDSKALEKTYVGDNDDRGSGGAVHVRRSSLDHAIKESRTAFVLQCCWDVPGTLSKLKSFTFPGWVEKDRIRDFLATYTVLIGDGTDFAYLTIEAYLERRWGEVGLAALRILAAAVGRTMFGGNTTLEADESGFPFETQHGLEKHIHFRLLPEPSERRQQLQLALRWLCAAVRCLPSGDPDMARIEGKPEGFQDFVWSSVAEEPRRSDKRVYYALSPWTSRPHYCSAPKPSCWIDLFARGAIIESPVSRAWGEGLETSFSTMVTLAGVENMYPIDGGIILLGFFTALVPVSRHEETNSIQWHLETSKDGIDPRGLECTAQDWFRTTDIQLLTKPQCFIGWFERAHVMLGTQELAYHQDSELRKTRLDPRKQTLRHVGHEAAVQLGFGGGPINVNVQAVSNYAVVDNMFRYLRPVQFSEALRRDRHEVALVIDAKSRRAWVVPLLSWILHLCHRYYIKECGKVDTPVPFAEPSPDGSMATFVAVEKEGSKVIFGDGTDEPETLRQLWLRISTNLGAPQPGHENPRKGQIFAAEAMDVLMAQDSYPKEIPLSKVSTSWAEFAKLARTTTVCTDLGDAIMPVLPSGDRCNCCKLPENQDFLAVHTWTLARLMEEQGLTFSQLGEEGLHFENGTSWRARNGLHELWTDFPGGTNCRNVWDNCASLYSILQRPEKVDRRESKGKGVKVAPPIHNGEGSKSGVVVFGKCQEAQAKDITPRLKKALNDRFGSWRLLSK